MFSQAFLSLCIRGGCNWTCSCWTIKRIKSCLYLDGYMKLLSLLYCVSFVHVNLIHGNSFPFIGCSLLWRWKFFLRSSTLCYTGKLFKLIPCPSVCLLKLCILDNYCWLVVWLATVDFGLLQYSTANHGVSFDSLSAIGRFLWLPC